MTRRLSVLALATAALWLVATAAWAHPLGNFTVNAYAGLTVADDAIDVELVLDLAELPTVQARPDADRDGHISATELDALAASRCDTAVAETLLEVDGRPLTLDLTGATAAVAAGEAGLSTVRIVCQLTAANELGGETEVRFALPGIARIGWREVTAAAGDGARLLASDVPSDSMTDALRSYPEDRLASPLEVTTAMLTAAPGEGGTVGQVGTAASADGDEAGLLDRVTTAYTDLVAERELTLGFVLFALLLSTVLGSTHALAPGHGKTVMAAYVVGQRGTLRQALLIGLTVAATHTLGVLVLGVILSGSETLAPERLYPWLGAASGLLLAAIGIGLLRRARASARHTVAAPPQLPEPQPVLAAVGHAAAGGHHHDHEHHGPGHRDDRGHEIVHDHGGGTHTHVLPSGEIRWRDLVTLGVAGGMVPSPSALVVLLGAVAIGRAWFGVTLVAAYGIGLAATLVVGGLLLVRGRRHVERWLERSERARSSRLVTALPTVTASLVVLGGLAVAARAVLTA